MEIIAQIIAAAPQHLTPTGQLWIEHEPAQVAAIATLAHEHGFTCVTHPDQYATPRYSVLIVAQ
jgi:methylase of polypeptide subunit release factors